MGSAAAALVFPSLASSLSLSTYPTTSAMRSPESLHRRSSGCRRLSAHSSRTVRTKPSRSRQARRKMMRRSPPRRLCERPQRRRRGLAEAACGRSTKRPVRTDSLSVGRASLAPSRFAMSPSIRIRRRHPRPCKRRSRHRILRMQRASERPRPPPPTTATTATMETTTTTTEAEATLNLLEKHVNCCACLLARTRSDAHASAR
mmetsp:Transcript_22177/g.50971  ORF Transcript_22177/g.50971 Transcript_22177/m.50971 type:complete len:203 (+) Transcript_22177:585-1193(+)